MSTGKEKDSCCDGIGVKELIVGSMIGGAIGASLALLFAPKSGEEMRREFCVKDLFNNGVDRVKQAASYVLNKDSEPYS